MSDSQLDCPKCDGTLETKTHEEISVQRCNSCYGLLIDPEMMDKMNDEWMVEKFFDVGPASVGRKYDKIDDIECPLCKIEMTRLTDPEQTHIWIETCPLYYRVFLDAGEYTDLKHHTFTDLFKRFLKGKRFKD